VSAPTAAELAAWEALAAKATAGPWQSRWTDVAKDEDHYETVVVSAAPGLDAMAAMVVGLLWWNGDHVGCSEPNAAFIAAARDALPRLCERVRALEAAVVAVRDALAAKQAEAERFGDQGGFGVTEEIERLDAATKGEVA
jgi:hypothetical protein